MKNQCSEMPLNKEISCKDLKKIKTVTFNSRTKCVYDEFNNLIGLGEMTHDNRLIVTQNLFIK